jgi:hypothetical protein
MFLCGQLNSPYGEEQDPNIQVSSRQHTWAGGGVRVLRGGLFWLWYKWCWCCMYSNCFNCAAKLMPGGPLMLSELLSPSSLVDDDCIVGMWDKICEYPPEEAVLLIAESPGNSLGGREGCICIKVCEGTVFSLVRSILNAALCCKWKSVVR